MSLPSVADVYAGLKKAREDVVRHQQDIEIYTRRLEECEARQYRTDEEEARIENLKRIVARAKVLVELNQKAISLDERYLRLNASLIRIDRRIEELSR